MAILEGMVRESFEDSIMINSLTKLQKAQVVLNEKLNNIFAQSLTKPVVKQQRKESESKP
jgi:hypothetical protein